MTRTWLSIRVDLVEGRGERLWPRPGRTFAAARSHTFAALATAIDDAFGRWDRTHLQEFHLADGTRLTTPYGDDDESGPVLDDRRTKLGGGIGCRAWADERARPQSAATRDQCIAML